MIWAADIVPVLSGAWAVKGLIPQRGLFVLYGHSGTGKSFLLVDMLLHIACGMEWAGRKVEPGLPWSATCWGSPTIAPAGAINGAMGARARSRSTCGGACSLTLRRAKPGACWT